jgi:hypothetical protein
MVFMAPPCAGITRIRFYGFDLSPPGGEHPKCLV